MIHHPVLAVIGLFLLILVCYLEVLYYRAKFPKTVGWLAVLFACGAGAAVAIGLSLIPEPLIMFQSFGTCGVMLFVIIGGGIVASHTAPKAAREAERNRQERK